MSYNLLTDVDITSLSINQDIESFIDNTNMNLIDSILNKILEYREISGKFEVDFKQLVNNSLINLSFISSTSTKEERVKDLLYTITSCYNFLYNYNLCPVNIMELPIIDEQFISIEKSEPETLHLGIKKVRISHDIRKINIVNSNTDTISTETLRYFENKLKNELIDNSVCYDIDNLEHPIVDFARFSAMMYLNNNLGASNTIILNENNPILTKLPINKYNSKPMSVGSWNILSTDNIDENKIIMYFNTLDIKRQKVGLFIYSLEYHNNIVTARYNINPNYDTVSAIIIKT